MNHLRVHSARQLTRFGVDALIHQKQQRPFIELLHLNRAVDGSGEAEEEEEERKGVEYVFVYGAVNGFDGGSGGVPTQHLVLRESGFDCRTKQKDD